MKLPAILRRNVYRTRPTHEQQLWLTRIRAADDPERELLAFETDHEAGSLHERALRSLRYRSRKLGRRLDPRTREQRLRRIRRRKGLDP